MLEIIDTRDPGAAVHIGRLLAKPFALVRLHRTYAGRDVVSLVDRYASREEADAGLIALARNSSRLPGVLGASYGRSRRPVV
jgi:hypothetical protein